MEKQLDQTFENRRNYFNKIKSSVKYIEEIKKNAENISEVNEKVTTTLVNVKEEYDKLKTLVDKMDVNIDKVDFPQSLDKLHVKVSTLNKNIKYLYDKLEKVYGDIEDNSDREINLIMSTLNDAFSELNANDLLLADYVKKQARFNNTFSIFSASVLLFLLITTIYTLFFS